MILAHRRACSFIADAGEPAAELNTSGELDTTIERVPDRGSLFLGDNEHLSSMKMRAAWGK